MSTIDSLFAEMDALGESEELALDDDPKGRLFAEMDELGESEEPAPPREEVRPAPIATPAPPEEFSAEPQAELSDDARLLVRFGLASSEYAEDIAGQSSFADYSQFLRSADEDIKAHVAGIKEQNPEADDFELLRGLYQEAGRNYFQPMVGADGKRAKNPALDPFSVKALARSVVEEKTYQQVVYDFYTDPSSLDGYEEGGEGLVAARAAIINQERELMNQFSNFRAYEREGLGPKRKDEVFLERMQLAGEGPPEGTSPAMAKNWTDPGGFSPQYTKGLNPTWQDAKKSYLNREIVDGKADPKRASVIDWVGKGYSEGHLPPGDWDPADFAAVEADIRDEHERMTSLSEDIISVGKLGELPHFERHEGGYRRERLGQGKVSIRRRESPLDRANEEFIKTVPVLKDIVFQLDTKGELTDMVRADAAQSQMSNALVLSGMSDAPMGTWKATQPTGVFVGPGGDGVLPEEPSWAETNVFAPPGTRHGIEPALDLTSRGQFEAEIAHKAPLMQKIWELDKTKAMLDKSTSVTAGTDGTVSLYTDENGNKFVRITPSSTYVPETAEMDAGGMPTGMDAEDALEGARRDARNYALAQPVDIPYLTDDQLAVKEGDTVKATDAVLSTNVSPFGASPMAALAIHSGLGGEVLTPQLADWFEQTWSLRWDPEHGKGGYVTAFDDPYAASREEAERGFWDRAVDDPLALMANFTRNVVETVGMIPALAVYSYNRGKRTKEELLQDPEFIDLASKSAGQPLLPVTMWMAQTVWDAGEDAVEVAPAAIDYMVEEMSYPGRYFFNNPLDAIAVLQAGAGMLRGGMRAGIRATLPSVVESRITAAGIKFSGGEFVHAGGKIVDNRTLRAIARGEDIVDDLPSTGHLDIGSAAEKLAQDIQADMLIDGAMKPTTLRRAMQNGFRVGAQFAEGFYNVLNPIEALRQTARGVGFGVNKFMGDVVKLDNWDHFWESFRAHLRDPSKAFDYTIITADGAHLNVQDILARRRGSISRGSDEAMTMAHAIPDEELARVEQILRLEHQGGAQFFIKVTDDMMEGAPGAMGARAAAGEAISLEEIAAKAGPELRGAITSKQYVHLNSSHVTLQRVRQEAHDALDVYEAARNSDSLQVKLATAADVAAWKKGKLAAQHRLTDVIENETQLVVMKRLRKDGSKPPGFDAYKTYMAAREALKKKTTAYRGATDNFVKSHRKFVAILPKSELPLARRRLPESQTMKQILTGGDGRFRIRDVDTNMVVDEFPTKRSPDDILERTRNDAKRAMATGGGGTTLEEMGKRFSKGDQIPFVPANHVAIAANYRMLQQLRRKIEDGTLPEKRQLPDGTWEGIGLDDIDEWLKEVELDKLTPDQISYIDWIGEHMDVPNMRSAVGVYASRLPGSIDDAHVQQLGGAGLLAADIRNKLMNLGAESVHLGLLPKDVFLSNIAVYFPHYYRKYAKEFADGISEVDNTALMKGQYEKIEGIVGHRMMRERLRDLELPKKYELGLVDDARYTAARGIIELTHDVEMARAFNLFATAEYADGPWKGMKMAVQSLQQPAPGWVRLAKNRKYGNLSERWVTKDMQLYLKRTVDVPGLVSRAYNNVLSRWKFGMTVLNPATHARNIMSNMVMADQAGMNPLVSESARRAWRGSKKEAWAQKGAWWNRALEDGLLGTDFVSSELRKELRKLVGDYPERKWDMGKTTEIEHAIEMTDEVMTIGESLRRLAKRGWSKVGRTADQVASVYRFEEDVFKLTRYKQIWDMWEELQKTGTVTHDMTRSFGREGAQKLGAMTKEQMRGFAVRDANKYFFDYGDISQAVEWVRQYWSPFITFQYKALPRVSEWLHKNPAKAFLYRRMFESLNFMTEYMDGTPPDPDTIRERNLEYWSLPAYARVAAMKLPGKSVVKYEGRPPIEQHRYVDIQHYTPVGGLMSPTLEWNYGLVPDLLEPRNPIMSTMIGPFFYNRPSWNAEEVDLVMSGTPSDVAWSEKAKESLRNALPPLTGILAGAVPVIGDALEPLRGRSATKFWAAMKGDPYPNKPEGRIDTVHDAMLDIGLGYRSFAVDIGGRKAIKGHFDRRKKNIVARRNKRLKMPDVKRSAAKQAEVQEEYRRSMDELHEWRAHVFREAAIDASMRGRAFNMIGDPDKVVKFPLPEGNFRRDRLQRLLERGERVGKRRARKRRKKKEEQE